MDSLLLNHASRLASAEGGEHTVTIAGVGVYLGVVLIAMFIYLSMAKKGFGQRVFKNFVTGTFEQLYLFLENMAVNTIGSHGRKYVPMLVTFWLVIFFANLVGLFFPLTPTAVVGFNLGMALIVFGYVQYEGARANGVLGHISHFAGPKLPGVLAVLITPIIFCIELVSELMKNVSLTLRLYGNIHGGHQAVEAINHLTEKFYIAAGEFLLPIKLLTVLVQAMIFCLLTCVYLGLVTGHHDDHEHGDGHGEAAHA
ncbi:MAG: F0F1 ATP synthase subunit A [Armatimonadetes bacterium]|nr:F0F1 ATP synthase subunit A [Armatimonadota bacterium]